MDRDLFTRLTMDAMAFTVLKDADRAIEALDQISESGDPFDMYVACCGFAEVAKRAMQTVLGETPDLSAGDMWILQEIEPGAMDADPVKTFSMRFMIAYANDDKDTTPALYRAALEAGPDQFAESVCQLLIDAADLHRLATGRQS
jgi:hypothetical protein